jgi:parvulin-like peptidyl-prolyl isomerase
MTLIINGERIEDTMIHKEMEHLRPRYEQIFSNMDPKERETQLRDWSKDNVIEQVVLRQEARKSTEEIPPSQVEYVLAKLRQEYQDQQNLYEILHATDDQQALEGVELQIKINHKLKEIGDNLPNPSQADMRKYYEENPGFFTAPEQIRVAHIVKYVDWRMDEATALEAITAAHNELENGIPFEQVVDRYTDCTEAGGDLGYKSRGNMAEEFDDVVFNLAVGQVSDIFRTRFGFHIAKVYARKPPDVLPFEKVKNQVLDLLKEQMRSDAVDSFVDQLKNQAKIEEV